MQGTFAAFRIGWFSVDLYSAYLPILMVLVPPALVKFVFATQQSLTQKYWRGVGYLILAGIAWAASIQVPNIPVGGSDSVSTHLMGGGIIVPLLYAYCKCRYISHKRALEMEEALSATFPAVVLRFAMFFAFSCAFGVLNEISELVLVNLHLDVINLNDADIDLAANTVGTVAAFIAMEVWRLVRPRK